MQKASAFGNYRAVVVDNKDKEQFGRVMVWIPDLMPEVNRSQGIWARPANNPLGGRNKEDSSDNYYAGTSYIPEKGSWVFVFFEGGNINKPYYFGALDLQNTKVLPENQLGSNPQNKWVVMKSGSGRAIVVSDDPDDERVEITGKKRLLSEPPTGDTFSVYRIDQNQNTILLDEREDTEKLLIKTHKGDFIKLGIKDGTLEILVTSNVEIKSGGHVLVTSTGDQHFLSGKNIHITAGENIHILSGGTTNIETGDEVNIKCGGSANETVAEKKTINVQEEVYIKGSEIHEQGSSLIARDASSIEDGSGSSQPPPAATIDAVIASTATPIGDREKS